MVREPTSKVADVLTTKVEQARAGDYIALLDLGPDPDEADVKQAYFRLARMVHPDTIRKQALMDRKDDAAFVFEKVTEAFQVLSDPGRRAQYIKKGGNAPGVDPVRQGKMLEEQAKIALHHGKMLLKRRAFADAESHFREYTNLKPDDARGYLYLGWSLFQNREKDLEERLEEAKGAFQRALKLDDESADGNYYLALYYKERGDFDGVAKFIKKALSLDPKHVPSLREQRLLEMRQQKQPETQSVGDFMKGLWGKLKKKR
jgi:curved DNA-binding protein CbpA